MLNSSREIIHMSKSKSGAVQKNSSSTIGPPAGIESTPSYRKVVVSIRHHKGAGSIPAEGLQLMMNFQWRSQPDICSCKCKFFCVYRTRKE